MFSVNVFISILDWKKKSNERINFKIVQQKAQVDEMMIKDFSPIMISLVSINQ